jgi:hypothetical protein
MKKIFLIIKIYQLKKIIIIPEKKEITKKKKN